MTDEDTPVRQAEGGTGRAARAPLPELLREFEELAAEGDARRRGRRLEQLVERVLHRAHFRVERNPVAGTPGRDDLVAGLAGRQYLVEVASVRHPVDVGAVDGLWSRLRRAGQGLVGVLVTVSGLAPDLAAQVLQNRRMGPVLVLDDADLRRVLADPGRLGRLLEKKREQLEAHDTVHLGRAETEEPERAGGSRPSEELPGSDTTLHDPSGGTVPFVVAAGSYAQQVFTLDLPAAGAGVALDLSLPLRDESQLLDLLDELDGLGWVTPGAGWAIGRGGRTWHGAGAAEFEAALTGRPKGADSETESIVWFDRCDGGFYTIGADLSLGDERRVTWCGISFRLIGVPLDPTSFQHLHTRFGARGRGWFRPLTEQPVERYGPWRPGAALEVVGSIVQDGASPTGQGWVVGVVARNPFHATGVEIPEGWPLRAGEDGLLLAALRDHHPAGEPEREYRLYGWEMVRSSDVAVLRVVAGAHRAGVLTVHQVPVRRGHLLSERGGRVLAVTVHRMPAAEVPIPVGLVRRLLVEQHPDLAALPVSVLTNGWDNLVCRLGAELLVRLPRRALAAELVAHEQRWLPELAGRLPLPVPLPVRIGRPTAQYPWSWSVVPFLRGRIAAGEEFEDSRTAAAALGGFLSALHTPAPPAAPANPYRGIPLAGRTEGVLSALPHLDPADRAAALRTWAAATAAPVWGGPPLWLHGDLHPANILVDRGRVSAVIDFGDLTAGDPAADLSVAWMLFTAERRSALRLAYGRADGATWERARGWALALSLAFLTHSADNPLMHGIGERTLRAVLER